MVLSGFGVSPRRLTHARDRILLEEVSLAAVQGGPGLSSCAACILLMVSGEGPCSGESDGIAGRGLAGSVMRPRGWPPKVFLALGSADDASEADGRRACPGAMAESDLFMGRLGGWLFMILGIRGSADGAEEAIPADLLRVYGQTPLPGGGMRVLHGASNPGRERGEDRSLHP